VREYKALKEENTWLKRLVADLSLDNQALKELAEGKW
jgi:cell division protein FtsB